MLDITIAEYLDMWISMLPFILIIGGVFSPGGIIGVFIRPIYSRMISIKRLQDDLALGSAVRLWFLGRWPIYLSLIVLYFIWGSLLLTPVVGLIPIILLEMRLNFSETSFFKLSPYLDIYGFFVLWFISIVFCFLIFLIGKKITSRQLQNHYNVSNGYLLLRLQFQTDTIIPSGAIKELTKDNQKLVTSLKILINWKRPITYEFHFSDRTNFNEFIEKISGMCSLDWQEKAVTPHKMFRIFYMIENLQPIKAENVTEFFESKTLQVIQLVK